MCSAPAMACRWDVEDTPALYDAQFAKAVELTGVDFMEALDYYGRSWLPARQCVPLPRREATLALLNVMRQISRCCPGGRPRERALHAAAGMCRRRCRRALRCTPAGRS